MGKDYTSQPRRALSLLFCTNCFQSLPAQGSAVQNADAGNRRMFEAGFNATLDRYRELLTKVRKTNWICQTTISTSAKALVLENTD